MRFGRGVRWKVGSGGVALLLVAASASYACTEVMGVLEVSPTSGPGGTVITTGAVGMKRSPARYSLLFSDADRVTANQGCHTSSVVLVRRIRTNAKGAWSNVTATIPLDAPVGVSQICGLEKYPNPGNTGTTHQTFTVT